MTKKEARQVKIGDKVFYVSPGTVHSLIVDTTNVRIIRKYPARYYFSNQYPRASALAKVLEQDNIN